MTDQPETPSRFTCGVHIEHPDWFFRWTNLPHAHCFAIVAFAFHIERAYRRSEVLRDKLEEPSDPGIRDRFGLQSHQLRVSVFDGALKIEDPAEPFRELAITDEGELYSVPSVIPGAIFPEEERTRVFDEQYPSARENVRGMLERSILLRALEVKGRRESALAKKEPIEWGCFTAGLEWDRSRCLFVLDGAKLYDVELRVSPELLPSDLPQREIPSEIRGTSAKRSGIQNAMRELWPGGIPKGMTVKQRDSEIMAFLEQNGVTAPNPRTIRRALQD